MSRTTKIVITGGPCAGKATALGKLEKHFTGMGYHVIFVNEAATELMLNGVVPWVGENTDFQNILIRTRRYKEQLYKEWVEKLDEEKILIACDSGMLDNKAYMSKEEFSRVLSQFAANGAEEAYIQNKANNPAHIEVEIMQTYLCANKPDEEIRVRQRGRDGEYLQKQSKGVNRR